MSKEAKSRIKINKLLETSGWRFFDDENGRANIQLEANVKLFQKHIDALGEDFEKSKNGFVDSCFLMKRVSLWSFLKRNGKKKNHWTVKNKPEGMPKA